MVATGTLSSAYGLLVMMRLSDSEGGRGGQRTRGSHEVTGHQQEGNYVGACRILVRVALEELRGRREKARCVWVSDYWIYLFIYIST